MTNNNDFQPIDSKIVPRFAGIATFLRTKLHEISDNVDIGLCGVPFDLGVNYRTGQRQGPSAVREASRLVRKIHPVSGIRPFEVTNVADLGDCPINPMSKDKSIAMIEDFFATFKENNIVPIAIGGDHTIPMPMLRSLAEDRPVGILHVDAHADVLDTICDDKINHATFMRRAMEEGLVDPNRVVQIGMRGSRFAVDDLQYSYDVGYNVITMDEYDAMGREATIAKIKEVLGDAGPVYISIDIDGLEPAYMPGTAVPEIGGIIPRDMQVILRSLQGMEIIGADISETAPCFDPIGITCVTVANLMFEILCITADYIDKNRS